jgi:hypothetical protein
VHFVGLGVVNWLSTVHGPNNINKKNNNSLPQTFAYSGRTKHTWFGIRAVVVDAKHEKARLTL